MSNEDVIRKHIRVLREAAGMSQTDIAVKLGIDQRSYARLERGERKRLDLQLLDAIANAIDVELMTLLSPITNEDKTPFVHLSASAANLPQDSFKHYEYIISQLTEIIETQKIIIEKQAIDFRENRTENL